MSGIKPLNAALGAEITDIDLSQELSAEQTQFVRDAFHEHLVLLFRNQDLEPTAQVRFTEIFGEAQEHPLPAG